MKGVTCGKRKTVTGKRGFFERRKTCPNFSIASSKNLRLKVFRGWIDGSFCSGWGKNQIRNSVKWKENNGRDRIHFLEKYRWFKKSSIFQYFLCTRISVYLFAFPISIDSFICFFIPCQLIRKFSLVFPDL